VVHSTRQAGCGALLSEDFQHQQDVDGLHIVNPFLESFRPLPAHNHKANQMGQGCVLTGLQKKAGPGRSGVL
jgi:hypothetical protein